MTKTMPPPPQRPTPSRGPGLASRALFGSTGALACGIGRLGTRSPRPEEGATLVVQLGDIGDLVLTSPFLRELGKAVRGEGGELILVVKPSVQALAELCPYTSRTLAFDTRRSRLAGALSGVRQALRFARTELDIPIGSAWNARFDVDELGASFLMLFSGAAKRIGYSEHSSPSKAWRNRGYDCLLSDPVLPAENASHHEADRLLALLEAERVPVAARDLELWLSEGDERDAREFLARAGERTPVGLGIGAGHPKRCWPADRFARVAEHLYKEHGAIAVLLGGPGERPAADEIGATSQVPVIDAVGLLPLRSAAALTKGCRAFIGNDSGLLHIAAAAQLPLVEISCHPLGGDTEHPNAPERFGPYGTRGAVLRPPQPASAACAAGCDFPAAHCIREITLDRVLGAMSGLLDGTGSGQADSARFFPQT